MTQVKSKPYMKLIAAILAVAVVAISMCRCEAGFASRRDNEALSTAQLAPGSRVRDIALHRGFADIYNVKTERQLRRFLRENGFRDRELEGLILHICRLRNTQERDRTVALLVKIYGTGGHAQRKGAKYVLDRLRAEIPVRHILRDAKLTYEYFKKKRQLEVNMGRVRQLIDELGETGVLLNHGEDAEEFLDSVLNDFVELVRRDRLSAEWGTEWATTANAAVRAEQKIRQYRRELEEFRYERVSIYLKERNLAVEAAFGKDVARRLIAYLKKNDIEPIEERFRSELFYLIALMEIGKTRPWLFEFADSNIVGAGVADINEVVYKVLTDKGVLITRQDVEDKLIDYISKELFAVKGITKRNRSRASSLLRLVKGGDMTLGVVETLLDTMLGDSNISATKCIEARRLFVSCSP